MHNIKIDDVQLRKRGPSIQKLLRIVARNSKAGPAWQGISRGSTYILGVHEGGVPPTSYYRDWRFSTLISGMRAMYFEEWIKLDRTRKWYLNKAYLNFYKKVYGSTEEEEFFCLHCDPNEPDASEHALYKKGPHVHVSRAYDHIPHSHIPLNRCHLPEILASLDSLVEAFEMGIIMIRDQILNPMKVQ